MFRSLRRIGTLARQEFEILKADPGYIVVFVALPLAVMGFVKPVFRSVLQAQGLEGANGAEHAVPGMAVLFALFLGPFVGYAFFREHGWNTWERLRASPASQLEIVAGKALPHLAVIGSQMLLLLALGSFLFGLSVRGSIGGLLAVMFCFCLAAVALSIASLALCSTVQQFDSVMSVSALGLAGIGGALTPLSTLPEFLRLVAPFTPCYWAMRGFDAAITGRGGLSDALLASLVLLAFAAAFTTITLARFRMDERKVSWA